MKSKQFPKKWELSINWINHKRGVFYQFDILPSLCFIKDSQCNEEYEFSEYIHMPYIAYSLYFQWLTFYVEIMYNHPTKK